MERLRYQQAQQNQQYRAQRASHGDVWHEPVAHGQMSQIQAEGDASQPADGRGGERIRHRVACERDRHQQKASAHGQRLGDDARQNAEAALADQNDTAQRGGDGDDAPHRLPPPVDKTPRQGHAQREHGHMAQRRPLRPFRDQYAREHDGRHDPHVRGDDDVYGERETEQQLPAHAPRRQIHHRQHAPVDPGASRGHRQHVQLGEQVMQPFGRRGRGEHGRIPRCLPARAHGDGGDDAAGPDGGAGGDGEPDNAAQLVARPVV